MRHIVLLVVIAGLAVSSMAAPEKKSGSPADRSHDQSNPKNQRTTEKLKAIKVPAIDFRQADISNVVFFLQEQSVLFDKNAKEGEEKGVEFVLNPGVGKPAGAVADPFAAPGGKMAPEFRINALLDYITLQEALDLMMILSGLKYRIVHGTVIVVPASAVVDERDWLTMADLGQDQSRPRNLRTIEKMKAIRLPEIDFRQANISDVAFFLQEQSILFDKDAKEGERKGVNIVLNAGQIVRGIDDPFAAGPDDFAVFYDSPPISTMAMDITLQEILDKVMTLTDMEYRLVHGVVLIEPKSAASKKDWQAPASALTDRDNLQTNPENLRTIEKMKTIVIPELDFRQADISDVIRFLKDQTVLLDKNVKEGERKGVNILMHQRAGDLTEFSNSAAYITLREILDLLMVLRDLQYRIVDGVVIIEPALAGK